MGSNTLLSVGRALDLDLVYLDCETDEPFTDCSAEPDDKIA